MKGDIDLGEGEKLRIFPSPEYDVDAFVPDEYTIIWWLTGEGKYSVSYEGEKTFRIYDVNCQISGATLTEIRDRINEVLEETL